MPRHKKQKLGNVLGIDPNYGLMNNVKMIAKALQEQCFICTSADSLESFYAEIAGQLVSGRGQGQVWTAKAGTTSSSSSSIGYQCYFKRPLTSTYLQSSLIGGGLWDVTWCVMLLALVAGCLRFRWR